ncbi:MAG: SET domain-containing protein [Ferruginibacter sp.]
MTKEQLLHELSSNTWVMIKPSPIEGIGVFAIRDIPAGCRDMFGKPDAPGEWITVPKNDIESLPEHARLLVGNYCLYDEENYFVPGQGFKKMDISLFLNHSGEPNIISVNDGDYFETTRDIKPGEELLIDYGEIVDGE